MGWRGTGDATRNAPATPEPTHVPPHRFRRNRPPGFEAEEPHGLGAANPSRPAAKREHVGARSVFDAPPERFAVVGEPATLSNLGSGVLTMIRVFLSFALAFLAPSIAAAQTIRFRYTGRIETTVGPSPLAQGTQCIVTVERREASEFNCRVQVQCAGRTVYGADGSGLKVCTFTSLPSGGPMPTTGIFLRDRNPASIDGDPMSDVDLPNGRVFVHESVPSGGVWTIMVSGFTLAPAEPPVAPPAPPPSAPPPAGCVPGSTQACLCIGGASGVQACNALGRGFDPCVCMPSPPSAPLPIQPTPPVCVPGSTQACLCVGGTSGVQACNAAGRGYDPCVCSPPPPAAATPEQFERVASAVRAAFLDDDKLNAFDQATQGSLLRFNCAQAVTLMRNILLDDGRLRLATRIWSRIVDPENINELVHAFQLSVNGDTFRRSVSR